MARRFSDFDVRARFLALKNVLERKKNLWRRLDVALAEARNINLSRTFMALVGEEESPDLERVTLQLAGFAFLKSHGDEIVQLARDERDEASHAFREFKESNLASLRRLTLVK
jgi:hypothetical protein